MERFVTNTGRVGLALLAVVYAAGNANAQRGQRMVYNPVTGQTEPELRSGTPQRQAQLAWQTHPARQSQPVKQAVAPPQEAAAIDPIAEQTLTEHQVEQAGLLAPACGCGDGACLDGACPDGVCGDLVGCGSDVDGCSPAGFFAGFEFTFVKPRFESNLAFTTTESDGVGNDVITETEFNYDLELTPRVYLGVDAGNGVALRATWWQFDHEASAVSANPPANGFGSIAHPAFGTVDIGSTVPTDIFAASSSLNAYSIDLEAVRETSFCGWDLEVGGGVRYSSTEQNYSASLTNAAGAQVGTIDFEQTLEGIGPTISLGASTPVTRRLSLYSKARGSLLFGDGESVLSAGEELNLPAAFTTNRTTNRDDVLSIGEVQLGFRWQGRRLRGMVRRPFASFAMEGQVWNGAGTASSEEGTLGFFGFTTQLGFDW